MLTCFDQLGPEHHLPWLPLLSSHNEGFPYMHTTDRAWMFKLLVSDSFSLLIC